MKQGEHQDRKSETFILAELFITLALLTAMAKIFFWLDTHILLWLASRFACFFV